MIASHVGDYWTVEVKHMNPTLNQENPSKAAGTETDTCLSLSSPAYSIPTDQLLAACEVNAENGLSAADVQRRRQRCGSNQLTEAPPVPAWRKFMAQFTDLVIWILIVAAVISGLMKEWADTAAILAIVVVNGIIGYLQEEKAGRALAALQKMSSPMARVIRDGVLQVIPAAELVPGDIIELEAGDNIPADSRLLSGFGLRVQEASLTGESAPVNKEADCVLDENSPLGDRRNMVYMGTVAAAGKARAIVVATGMTTELGHIAGMLQRTELKPTPLQRRLAELGKVLVLVCLGIVVVIFALQLWRGGEFLETLLISVSLAVAAVPEGLPAVVTLTLALGLQRMVKRNALVRKLPSVETLGFWIIYQGDESQVARARTVTFCVSAFSQLFFAIGCRSQRFTMPEMGLFTNPQLFGAIVISGLLQLSVVTLPFAQPVFEVATHLTWEWILIGGLALTPVTVVEIVKIMQGSRDLL